MRQSACQPMPVLRGDLAEGAPVDRVEQFLLRGGRVRQLGLELGVADGGVRARDVNVAENLTAA